MPCYAVSYQLNDKKDYPKLWKEMDRLEGHKVMRSFYYLDLNLKTAPEVRDHLAAFIDDDDAIAVVPFTQRPSHANANVGTNDWLEHRF